MDSPSREELVTKLVACEAELVDYDLAHALPALRKERDRLISQVEATKVTLKAASHRAEVVGPRRDARWARHLITYQRLYRAASCCDSRRKRWRAQVQMRIVNVNNYLGKAARRELRVRSRKCELLLLRGKLQETRAAILRCPNAGLEDGVVAVSIEIPEWKEG